MRGQQRGCADRSLKARACQITTLAVVAAISTPVPVLGDIDTADTVDHGARIVAVGHEAASPERSSDRGSFGAKDGCFSPGSMCAGGWVHGSEGWGFYHHLALASLAHFVTVPVPR